MCTHEPGSLYQSPLCTIVTKCFIWRGKQPSYKNWILCLFVFLYLSNTLIHVAEWSHSIRQYYLYIFLVRKTSACISLFTDFYFSNIPTKSQPNLRKKSTFGHAQHTKSKNFIIFFFNQFKLFLLHFFKFIYWAINKQSPKSPPPLLFF